jgi:DNA processing protein
MFGGILCLNLLPKSSLLHVILPRLGKQKAQGCGICYSLGEELWKQSDSDSDSNPLFTTIPASFAAALTLVGVLGVFFQSASCVMIVSKTRKKQRRSQIRKESTDPHRVNTVSFNEETKMESIAAKQAKTVKAARSYETPYLPPGKVTTSTLGELIFGARSIPEHQQERMGFRGESSGVKVWLAGDVSLVKKPCVSVVGAREVSKEGAARARRLAKELAKTGIVTVSGLAKGVDTQALTEAMNAGGSVIAVIGTPIDRAYPAENKRLQEKIYRDHLLVSQFPPGKKVFPSNFPERNQLMAAISDATVIVEASDTSGSLHQAVECSRLGRWLFIAKSLAEDPSLTWPQKFLAYPTTRILTQFSDITGVIRVN